MEAKQTLDKKTTNKIKTSQNGIERSILNIKRTNKIPVKYIKKKVKNNEAV